MSRIILLALLCGLLPAQQQAPPQQPPPDSAQPATLFRGGVEVVQAPVLVFDRDGNFVTGTQRVLSMKLRDETPRIGHGGARIAFIDPASTGNVLTSSRVPS